MKVDFNTDADHIDIPNSRIKLFILLLGAIVGIAVGVWFIIDPSKFEYARVYYTPDWKTEIIGCVCVISCSLCVLGIIYMIFKNNKQYNKHCSQIQFELRQSIMEHSVVPDL